MNDKCMLCDHELPRGVCIAFFETAESDEPFIGNFCCVEHAFESLRVKVEGSSILPDSLFLGIRVDRKGHDEQALATIMGDIARRAVQAALSEDDLEDDDVDAKSLN